MPKTLTKKQAVIIFKRDILPGLRYSDKIAVITAWNDYTDMLHREGEITDHQVNTWLNPFEYRR